MTQRLTNSSRWHSIAEELAHIDGRFPLAAVLEARDYWSELRSNFLHELSRAIAKPEQAVSEENALPIYAMYLAAEKRDAAFAPVLLDLLKLQPDDIDELFGETTLTEGVGRCLGAVWQGDETPIWDIARDENRGGSIRLTAIDALVVRLMEGDTDPGPVTAGIFAIASREAGRLIARQETKGKSRWHFGQEESFSFFNLLLPLLAELGATAHWPQFEIWNSAGLVDPLVESMAGLRETMFASPETRRAHMFKPFYVRDTVDEMSWWACFNEPEPPEPYLREEPKIGRNDPCPCGSGRKFKKCCGANL